LALISVLGQNIGGDKSILGNVVVNQGVQSPRLEMAVDRDMCGEVLNRRDNLVEDKGVEMELLPSKSSPLWLMIT
jgi:hypothetical protein